jgi:NFU1 iron-sulfur cluster scaffold homolog, mitochondrial
MFIQTEATPNPETLKFLPGREVLASGVVDCPDVESAHAQSPLAEAIFAVEGVKRVFLGSDFVSVSKDPDMSWAHVKPFVLGAIMEHFVSERPVLIGAQRADDADEDDTVYEGEAAEIVEQIKDLIETRVRPAVAQDGGDISFHSWEHEHGIVKLNMRGSCAGCPSSTLTLKSGIENLLRHYVPEVNAVEQVM